MAAAFLHAVGDGLPDDEGQVDLLLGAAAASSEFARLALLVCTTEPGTARRTHAIDLAALVCEAAARCVARTRTEAP